VLRSLRIENLVLIRDAELSVAPGLNAVTGETGAGKTILAQAFGLLLGARGDAGYLGPAADEAYVEAELDLPDGILDDPDLAAVAELKPEGETSLIAARRVFADGRTRAYAWGRSVPREELATLLERLVAMSGQFEQRRLARPSYQLDILDAFAGEEQLRRRAEHGRAWKELAAARRRRDELAEAAAGREAHLAELAELVERTSGFGPGGEERLKGDRERLRHVTELASSAAEAAELLVPDGDGAGASEQAAQADAALERVTGIAPELDAVAVEIRQAEVALSEAASTLRGFLASLEAEPDRVDQIEAELDRIAEAKRRFGAASYEELLERAGEAQRELDAAEAGLDPLAEAERALAEAERKVAELATALGETRRANAGPFSDQVESVLGELAMGSGEFRAEVRARTPGPSGADEVAFLIRPNEGVELAPVAETASGGELSRVALALRVVAQAGAGEPTVVFDEIDAGIGGETAHAVAEALRTLAGRAQVITITHLPQIASVAGAHFRVEKIPGDPTHTRIERLDDAQRRDELERMLGGADFLAALGRQ
jgi:DNA repair protein RecN (Recombination protein N)